MNRHHYRTRTVAGLLGRYLRSNHYHTVLKWATSRTPPEAHAERKQEIFTACSPCHPPRVSVRDKLRYRYANKNIGDIPDRGFLPKDKQAKVHVWALTVHLQSTLNPMTFTCICTILTYTWAYTDGMYSSQVASKQHMCSLETY